MGPTSLGDAVGGHAGREPVVSFDAAPQELDDSMLGSATPRKQAGIHTTS